MCNLHMWSSNHILFSLNQNSADRRKEDCEGTRIIKRKCEICKNVLELTTSGDLAFLFKEKQGHDTDETGKILIQYLRYWSFAI